MSKHSDFNHVFVVDLSDNEVTLSGGYLHTETYDVSILSDALITDMINSATASLAFLKEIQKIRKSMPAI